MKVHLFKKLITSVLLSLLIIGTVFVAAYAVKEPETVIPSEVEMEIVANNVSYSDSLYILYAVKNEGFDRTQHEIKMLFWDEARESYALGTEKYSVTNSGKAKIKGEECLIFYTNGIAAKEMTDDIYARACVVIDGNEYYTDVMKFSVLEYVHAMQEQGNIGNGQLKLFTSMLEYGTAAQNSFGHNTNRPANGKYYKISVIDGTLPDGFTTGRYLAGEKVVITANAPAPGMRFSHWLDENGILVSFDAAMEITVSNKNKKYFAVYKDVSNVVAQMMLKAEIPYNGDLDDIDLPTAVTFEVDGNTVTLEVAWNTEGFAPGSIGKQNLYAELKDLSAYAQYGIEPGSIVLEVTTLPYAYELDSANGEYVITGYYGDDESITLPSSYKNTYITRIATRAFNNVMTLKEVVIPSTIQKIDNGAFFYCDNIEKMTVPFIGESATSSNSWFGWIFGATQYDAQHGMLPLRFKSITLADGATEVPQYAFYKCAQITEFHLPDSVKYFYDYAFDYCTGLTELTLPASLSNISGMFNGCTNLKRVNVASLDSIFNIGFNNGNTNVGPLWNGAELYCNGKLVTEVTIPNGVTKVYLILQGCTSIEKVTVPASVQAFGWYAFANMPALKEVVFEDPSKITSIGYGLFYNCTALTSVDLSGFTGLKTLDGTFRGCTSLTEVKLPEGLTSLENSAFAYTAIKSIVLPDGIQKIPNSCFSNCKSLESIAIPDGVVEIGQSAFYNCTALLEVDMPAALTSIGSEAFRSCTKLAVIDLPERVYDIGSRAFDNCSNLSRLIIRSERLTTVGSNAFYNCTKLYEIFNLSALVLTPGSTDYGSMARYAKVIHTSLAETAQVFVDENGFILCLGDTENIILGYVGSATEITLPVPDNGKPTRVYENAFYGYSNLNAVIIANGVETIDDYAFSYCEKLTSIVIPDSVTTIGKQAFYSCDMLVSVTLGSGVEIIGEEAFFHCYRLVEVINRSALNIRAGYSDNGDVAYYAEEVHTGESKIVCVGDYLFYAYNGMHYLVAYTGSDAALTLPASYNGASYEINRYAFRDCTAPTTVTIPDSVTEIGSAAFYNCNSLTSVTIPNSVTTIGSSAFDDCYSLTSVTIPDSVTTIGSYAFAWCRSLTSVTIPDSVTTIGSYAFYNCTGLTSIMINSKKVTFGEDVFKDCNAALFTEDDYGTYVGTVDNPYAILISVKNKNLTTYVIHEGTEFIAYGVFRNCANMTIIAIPDSVTSICSYAFYNCKNLTDITLGSGVTSIGGNAFSGCNALQTVHITDMDAWCKIAFASNDANPMYYADQLLLNGKPVKHVVIPDDVTEIKYTFYRLSGLESVVIPNSVTTIGHETFYGCNALETVHITDMDAWCKIAFASLNANPMYYADQLLLNGEPVKHVVIPESVTTIGSYAFYNCNSLTSVTIPDSVTEIGSDAFYNCNSLTSVTIPDSVTTIGSYAFYVCYNIKNINYRGTEEQWNAITKGNGWDSNIRSYTLTYNYDGE